MGSKFGENIGCETGGWEAKEFEVGDTILASHQRAKEERPLGKVGVIYTVP